MRRREDLISSTVTQSWLPCKDEPTFLKTVQWTVLVGEMSKRITQGVCGDRASEATLCAPYCKRFQIITAQFSAVALTAVETLAGVSLTEGFTGLNPTVNFVDTSPYKGGKGYATIKLKPL